MFTLFVSVLDSFWCSTVVGDCLLLVMDSCWCWTVVCDCLLLVMGSCRCWTVASDGLLWVEEQLLAIHGFSDVNLM